MSQQSCIRRKKRHTYIQSPENREWISIIEIISATGDYIRPLVMFKGENLPDWQIASTSKGWTSNNITLRWLKEFFLPEKTHILNNGQICSSDDDLGWAW
jgi:hypothetical protein